MSVVPRPSKEGNPELVYWPKHLLPETLPSARVLVYGYDTKVRHALGAPISKNTVYDIALDFLGSLEAQRRQEPCRPLVFIAHSLGGIVVKELLRRSYGFSDRQPHLHHIYKATSAVIFFGTPHGGADPRGFREHLIEQVARAAGLTVNEQIVSTLLPNSERLRELRDEFGSLARRQSWVVYSFQEQYGVQLLGGKKVVEDVSSCLGNAELEITQHIASDHRDMCRFSGLHDLEYTKVAAALEHIKNRLPAEHTETKGLETDPALKSEQRQLILDALSFRAIDARYSTVKAAHAKTCRWLLQRSEYQDWCDNTKTPEHHGLLWIKGKPGSGKSTLVKFAVQNARKANKEAKVICFFFNARGENLEKTTLGMYRTLLLQLLQEFPDLQMVLDSFSLTGVHDRDSYAWRQSDLQSLFAAAVQRLGQRQLICFIDALDECDEDQIRDLVLFLEETGRLTTSSQINFRACLSSRHYPYISIEKGIELTLEGQEGHVQDIASYLDSELKAGKGNQIKAIKENILTRASGIFLWVALVVQILNKEYDHGRVHALRTRLSEIPDGLDKLFEDILTRDCANSEELVLCLQWILYSTRPLKREELYYAILSGTDSEALTTSAPEVITPEDMERFILSCSKGLAETTKLKRRTVQFIHESVRDFLLGKNGFSKLRSELGAGQSHDRLKQCCCVYLKVDISGYLTLDAEIPKASSEEAKDLRARVSTGFPFLEYAVHNVLIHADSASNHGVSQASLVHDFTIDDWIRLYNLFEKFQVRRHDTVNVPSLLDISIKNNLAGLIGACLQVVWRSYQYFAVECSRDFRYTAAVTAALGNLKINDDTVRALLIPTFQTVSDEQLLDKQKDLDHGNERIAAEMIIKRRPFAVQAQDFYSWAASGGYVTVIRLLLTRTSIRPNYRGDLGPSSPIAQAASNGHAAVVKLLLDDSSTAIDLRNKHGQRALSLAASNGYVDVVKSLLQHASAEHNRPNEQGRSPLSWAASNGHLDVVDLLLRHDPAEYIHQDKQGRSPLSYAASSGHEEIVKLLLAETSIATDESDKEGRTPLSWAAGSGRVAVVELLLAYGHKADCMDKQRRTPLSWAASNQHEAVGDILLAADNVNTDAGQIALSYAAMVGKTAIVKLLLAKDSIIADHVDAQGRTPLLHAASNGHEEIVKLLLAKSTIATCTSDNDGRTPLSWAAGKGHDTVVKLLLASASTQYDCGSRDKRGLTPLSWAAYSNHYAVMNLLLATGWIDPDIGSPMVNAGLHWAASHGYLEESVLNLLRRKGLPVSNAPIAPNEGPATDEMTDLS
ncbi:MAG: hypothetical protein Q9208_007332 [Pyrenodesmia sp. 3 TL-2023]